ncbi:MAG: DUF4167 domain-containing protein [Rhodospirillaceae bacterium]
MKNANTRGRPRGRNVGGKRPPNRNQTFDSNGPGVRVRGNAQQIVEKYLSLARDSVSQGDRVLAENYFQHADHYQRILNALTGRYNRVEENSQPQTPAPTPEPRDSANEDDAPEEEAQVERIQVNHPPPVEEDERIPA